MNDEQVYDFGIRLRQLREERGLSRAALAKKLGVSEETVYRYENNTQAPSLERTKQIAVILRTSIDYRTIKQNIDIILGMEPEEQEQQRPER